MHEFEQIIATFVEESIDMIAHFLFSEVLTLSLTVSNWELLLTAIFQSKSSFFIQIVKAVGFRYNRLCKFDLLSKDFGVSSNPLRVRYLSRLFC